jgi:SWI/SNF-related matrix-associated actin-dependent regulator 1 of chromatin subfamily A
MRADLKLMPFQDTGADRLAATKRGFLVWEPGVGKTPTAVRACVKASARRILVFCPPIGVSVWRKHFEDWSNYTDIRVMTASWALTPYQFMEGSGVRIIPYSRARPGTSIIKAVRSKIEGWDVAILDEAHYLKTSTAQRTKALYGVATDLKGSALEHVGKIWVLTGTPILNHPAEFWTHLRALSPEVIFFNSQLPIMTYDFFVGRYCVTRPTPYGVRIMGGRNAHELADRIRPIIDRKRIKDVIADLPELRIVEHPLPADTPIDPILRDALAEALKDLDAEDLDDEQLLASIQAAGISFSTVRRLIGRAKVAPSAMLIADMLDDAEDEKLIVFCHHREVIRDLADQLKRFSPLVIHGGTLQVMRDSSIWGFQNDPRFRLIILAIDTAGEVITLHASHNVLLIEPSPVPERNKQAIGRAYRRGQKHPVIARFVLLPGTLDARLMSIIARKTKDISAVIDHDLVKPKLSTGPSEAALAFPDTI